MGEDGKIYAINPEAGFYDVATGTSELTNKSGMATLRKNTIFTNVALTADGDVWWEGLTKDPPPGLVDWSGKDWKPELGVPAAHPNSRFTAPSSQCPVLDPEWENPNGIPISAFLFAGKRKTTLPLIIEAATWEQGIFLASLMSVQKENGSATTISREPFAVTPFLGYSINDYLQHWIGFRALLGYNIPKIFLLNYFRQNSQGQYLWPGFDENSRLLKFIHARVTSSQTNEIIKTPIGLIPQTQALDLRGTIVSRESVKESLVVNREEWLVELLEVKKFYETLGAAVPHELLDQLEKVTEQMTYF
jgi:phosphoenolpyruvate carboxykinase (GTP)